MIHNRRRSDRAQPADDKSGRIALIGLFVVLSLLAAAIQFIT